MRYRILGSVVESDLPLPELPLSCASRVQIRAYLRSRAVREHDDGWRIEPSRCWPRVSRRAGEWRLRFPNRVQFFVSLRGGVIQTDAPAEFPRASLRHLLIDQVIPMVLSARGHLILHGSGVRTPWGGILLVGPSGAGKSTLAVKLADLGWKLLSDDYVRVRLRPGGAEMIAAYPGARVWPDVATALAGERRWPRVTHCTTKRRLIRGAFDGRAAAAATLRRIYLLGGARELRLKSSSKRDALVALLAQALRLDIGGPGERRRFDLLASLCETVPLRRLSYPRTLASLDAVRDAIQHDLSPGSE